MRMKRKYVLIGIPVILIVGAVGGWFYRQATLPVGKMQGNTLVFEGNTYVADLGLQTNQKFFYPVGKTQGGDSIGKIDQEDPKDYVYVVGEMWEGVYRREDLPTPPLNNSTIAAIELQGISKSHNTSVDLTTKSPQLIQELVADITTTDVKSWTYAIVPSHDLYGLVVQRKGHPGLESNYLVESDGKHLYLDIDKQDGKFMNIAGTTLGNWILEQTR